MAVIILLLSILIVAVNAAARTAQGANTQALMASMNQALVRFKGDIGYYPPVLGPEQPLNPTDANEFRRLKLPPDPEQLGAVQYRFQSQLWYSVTTLAEYLIGYGSHEQDGYGIAPGNASNFDWDFESPPIGIRNPGPDGVWGAAISGGWLENRMGGPDDYSSEVSPLGMDQGQLYGPYIELKDERLLAAVDDRGNVVFPGQASVPGGPQFGDLPKVIVDYWGTPIRYYRRLYPFGSLQSPYRSFDPSVRQPMLSDVFVLRPWEMDEGAAVEGLEDFTLDDGVDDVPDNSTTIALNSAEFALFSAGPDRAFNIRVRIDREEFNRDNIVELGP
jgi:hypothetical protein